MDAVKEWNGRSREAGKENERKETGKRWDGDAWVEDGGEGRDGERGRGEEGELRTSHERRLSGVYLSGRVGAQPRARRGRPPSHCEPQLPCSVPPGTLDRSPAAGLTRPWPAPASCRPIAAFRGCLPSPSLQSRPATSAVSIVLASLSRVQPRSEGPRPTRFPSSPGPGPHRMHLVSAASPVRRACAAEADSTIGNG